jgi:branched-chain amino acid transport system ATP-binding protein
MMLDVKDRAVPAVPALAIRGVEKVFGGVRALSDVSFNVPSGQVTALIGPNGAGKTTLFNVITSVLSADGGDVHLFGTKLTDLSPVRIANLGLIRTFQTARVFPGMSVLENVMLGRHRLMRTHGISQALWLPRARREDRQSRERAEHLLETLELSQYRNTQALTLPIGAQKLVEIARALMAAPRLLCLDEPAAGLNDVETQKLSNLLGAIRQLGITLLIVEHNMPLIMNLADRIVVLDAGKLVMAGTPGEVRKDQRVIEAYLGSTDNVAS